MLENSMLEEEIGRPFNAHFGAQFEDMMETVKQRRHGVDGLP